MVQIKFLKASGFLPHEILGIQFKKAGKALFLTLLKSNFHDYTKVYSFSDRTPTLALLH